MPITVNQNMVNFIADDDTIDGFITVSANVDPGNLIQEVILYVTYPNRRIIQSP